MTPKERYIAALTFGNPDKFPLNPGWPREHTLRRWVTEGLPAEFEASAGDAISYVIHELLGIPDEDVGIDPGLNVDFRMIPWFKEEVLEHKNGHYIVRDWMGAITEISDEFDYTYIRTPKDFVTRKWHKFPVENREDWEKMKERFDAMTPERVPADIAEIGQKLRDYKDATTIHINGPFWQLREFMGMENLCMAFLDDPELVRDMIGYWCDFAYRIMAERVLPYAVPTAMHFSEDMAYKAHSMISPAMTREFLMPCYLKWIDLFNQYNIPVINMDSDGYIEELIPIWIESGIHVCEPIEVAAGNDIVHFREKFGTKMVYCGGIDKRAIAAGGEVMRAEVMRVVPPLLKQGGFIPSCDHGVPHDISFPNFVEYTRLLAQLTGWL